jgi:twitching motility protein PilT
MDETNVLSLTDLLEKVSEMKGSDLHLSAGSAPRIRVHGQMLPLNLPPLGPAETKRLAYSVMTDDQKFRYEEALEIDFSFGVKGLARFRANVFTQRGAVSAVFRLIPFGIQSFEELNVPPIMERLCEKPRGLVLITGPTGSGKTTTLAAMIDKINREKRGTSSPSKTRRVLHEHRTAS